MTESSRKAQGAFEYLMSYGWAIIVVAVLGIVLYNLGAFNPSQTTVISGFAFVKPLSVQVNPQDSNNAMLVLQVQNTGGREFQVSSTTISTPSANCSYVLNFVQDSSGNTLATSHPFTLSAGQGAKLTYWANGTNCGSNNNYNYKISFSGMDSFGMQQTDFGSIRGKPKVCNFPQSGLVGLWRFKEGSGTVTADDSGNGNAGALVSGPARTLGKTGFGVSLDGINGFVNVTEVSNLSFASPNAFSYGAWFKASTLTSWGGVISRVENSGYNGYNLQIGSANNIACFAGGSGSATYTGSNSAPVAGVWYHGVCVYNGTTMNLYLNGVKQNSPTNTVINTGAFNLKLGVFYADQTLRINGTIDDAFVYNRALSASEIQQIYNCGLP